MAKWIAFVIRFRYLVLFLCMLATIFLLTKIKSLEVVVDVDKLTPQGHPYAITGNMVEKVFGGKFLLVVGVSAKEGSIYTTHILNKVKTISNELLNVPGVIKSNMISIATKRAKSIEGSVDGMTVRRLMEKVPETTEEINILKTSLEKDEMFQNLLISKDGQTTQIIVEMKPVNAKWSETVDEVRKVLEKNEDASVKLTMGGGPVFAALAEKYSKRMAFLFPLALLIIGLIHYEAFRTFQSLFLPLVTALLAVIWALGGLALIGQPLDAFNVSTPILILAIAAGHAVQILKRYYEDFAIAKSSNPNLSPKEQSKQAVQSSLSSVGPVMVVAGLIAAISFLSLTIFEIKTIQIFGIFTAIGVISALILELTFIPALRTLLPAPSDRELRREQERTFWDRLIEKFYILAVEKRKIISFSIITLVIVLSIGGFWLKVENSQRIFYSPDSIERLDDDWLNATMGGTTTFYVAVVGSNSDDIKDPVVLSGIEKIQNILTKENSVGKTVSIVDFIKKMNQAIHNGEDAKSIIPDTKDEVAQTLFLYSSSGEPGDLDPYVDSSYQRAVIKVFLKNDNSMLISEIIKKVKKTAAEHFSSHIKVDVGGGVATTIAINEVMVKEKIYNILQIMFAVFIIASLVFLSPLAGVFTLLPLIAAVIVNFGVMGLFGIPLQLGTAVISAMAVGIGADYTIYMMFRMREELRKNSNETEAIKKAYFSSGKAILFVSSAIAGGFGVLILSRGFMVHIWLGWLIGLATLVSSITTLTLFPALILKVKPKFMFKDAKETKKP